MFPHDENHPINIILLHAKKRLQIYHKKRKKEITKNPTDTTLLDKAATTEHFCLGNTPMEERSKKFIRYPSTISEENHASEADIRTMYNRARSLPRAISSAQALYE